MQVVWFKKDLRVHDNAPLFHAARSGKVCALYIYEPSLIESPEFHASHLSFINQSLLDLEKRLKELGAALIFRKGEVVQVLDELHENHGIETLWSHEETGNMLTYKRDIAVKAFAKKNDITWHEIPQNGVIRPWRSRDEGWSRNRQERMRAPLVPVPEEITCAEVDAERIYNAADFDLEPSTKTLLQEGGETCAILTLNAFLKSRGESYDIEMSGPNSAFDSCSRLSAYLAYGNISMKRVEKAVQKKRSWVQRDKARGRPIGRWLSSLRSFESRLSWHCHFMQKLEDEPMMEFRNLNRAYDGFRDEENIDDKKFRAWCEGQTGYPMVDACMRALHEQSWINFRMRAMLVSFATMHLWLHWRKPAVFLAQHFLDFEPGIHFAQFQMQAGTTGINTPRVYSPLKQIKDQDPEGVFIKRFVPELRNVPKEHIAEPHKMSVGMQEHFGCVIGKDYPAPIVDHKVAYNFAKDKMFTKLKEEETRLAALGVFIKHGSRRRRPVPRRRR